MLSPALLASLAEPVEKTNPRGRNKHRGAHRHLSLEPSEEEKPTYVCEDIDEYIARKRVI
jgi:hypothetical protein